MSKINAVIDLSREFTNQKPTIASFKRSIKAAKTLGFTKDETLRLLTALEFCDSSGNGFKAPFVELMQQFMAKPEKTINAKLTFEISADNGRFQGVERIKKSA